MKISRNFLRLTVLISAATALSASAATITGLWEFDNASNLAEATIGNDLIIGGAAPTHSASLADDSSTSMNGVITTVGGTSSYLKALHAIPANGGGLKVNQYSIVVDIFSPVASRGNYRAIFQTDASPTGSDADYFIHSNDGLGTANQGYSSSATIDESVWTRLVITVDLTQLGGAGAPKYIAYLDGVLAHAHTGTTNGGVDGRFSLFPDTSTSGIYFFADNTASETPPMNIGAIAIFDGVLTPAEVGALGVTGAAIPEPSAALLSGLGVLALLRRRR